MELASSGFDDVSLSDSDADASSSPATLSPVLPPSSLRSSHVVASHVGRQETGEALLREVAKVLSQEERKEKKLERKRERRRTEKIVMMKETNRQEKQDLLHVFADLSDQTRMRKVLDFIFDIDPPYCCGGVPISTFALWSFLSHWGIFAERKEGKEEEDREKGEGIDHKDAREQALWLTVRALYERVEMALREGRRLVYWFSNVSVLVHLLLCKRSERKPKEAGEKQKEKEQEDFIADIELGGDTEGDYDEIAFLLAGLGK